MAAPREALKNSGRTTLNGAINDSVTSITVTDGSVFPSSGRFQVRVGDEIMRCTARSSNVLTVTRAQEGTTAASHADAAVITAPLTAAGLQRYGRDNDAYFDSSRPPLGRIVSSAGLVLTSSDFTWANQGTSSVADQNGTMVLTAQSGVTAGTNSNRILYRTAPGTPYAVVAGLRCCYPRVGSTPTMNGGLCFRKNSTGYITMLTWVGDGTFAVYNWTSPTVYSSTPLALAGWRPNGILWMKLADNGTNLLFSLSHDGFNWIQVYSYPRATFMSGGPDQIAWFANTSGNTVTSLTTLVHWDEGATP